MNVVAGPPELHCPVCDGRVGWGGHEASFRHRAHIFVMAAEVKARLLVARCRLWLTELLGVM